MKSSITKKMKIAIIIFVTVFLLAIISLLIINILSKRDSTNTKKQEVNTVIETSIELNEIKSVSEYINVNDCVNKYLGYLSEKNAEAVYEELIGNYIDYDKITSENVLDKLKIDNSEYEFSAKKIYRADIKLGIGTYFVEGKVYNKKLKESNDYRVIVNIDSSKNTFEIAPMEKTYTDYIDYSDKDNIVIKDEKIENEINDIKKNEFNNINSANIFEDKQIMAFYFKQYILDMIYDTQEAYELLDDDYREKKFENYENFENYVKENSQKLEKSILLKYKIESYDDYKEYLCKDNYNNVYIFKEESPMNYTVILDQYTIDDQIFLDQFMQGDRKKKAQMNLNKFEQMLNRKDYDSAYNMLNQDFKEKYFQTRDDFIKYVENNFFEYNDFNYEEISSSDKDDTTEYKIKTEVKDAEGKMTNSIVKRFKVQMSNKDFNIAFDI